MKRLTKIASVLVAIALPVSVCAAAAEAPAGNTLHFFFPENAEVAYEYSPVQAAQVFIASDGHVEWDNVTVAPSYVNDPSGASKARDSHDLVSLVENFKVLRDQAEAAGCTAVAVVSVAPDAPAPRLMDVMEALLQSGIHTVGLMRR